MFRIPCSLNGSKRPLRDSLQYRPRHRLVPPPRLQFEVFKPVAAFYALIQGWRDLRVQQPSLFRPRSVDELRRSIPRMRLQLEQAAQNRVITARVLNIAGFRVSRRKKRRQ